RGVGTPSRPGPGAHDRSPWTATTEVRMRSLTRLVPVLGILLCASSASATSLVYAEVWTNKLLGNIHAELTTLLAPKDIGALLSHTDIDVLGKGLDWGYVSTSSPLDITHTFAPDLHKEVCVQSAKLYVSTVDDSIFDDKEYAAISIGGDHLGGGKAGLNLFEFDVTNYIGSIGDSFTQTIAATKGDFK